MATAEALAEICGKYHIRELRMFGSVARGEQRPDSDIDLMAEFEAGYHPGLGWFDLEEELGAAFGRQVDLSQKALLKPRVRAEAERDGIVLYAG